MIKMFPVLFTDLGGAIMYQCFTIMYGIDIDATDIKMSPNAFWDLKSLKASDKTPSVGTINPTAQVEKVLSFISQIMGAWAESKSIKIGNIGKIDGDNITSGVSKIVDQMDTFEVRKKNIPFFRKEEKELWYLLALMNNHWIKSREIDLTLYPTAMVNPVTVKKTFGIDFEPPRPMENRSDVVNTQVSEFKNRFTTRKRAIEKINPELDDTEVEELIKEIDLEDGFDENEPDDDNNNNDEVDDEQEQESKQPGTKE